MEQNKTARYLKYAIGEIVLVVIGILLALQINNWNERNKMKGEEIKLLKETRSALMSDREDILSNIAEHLSASNSCAILINQISNNLPYHDSLDLHFANALNTTRFAHTSSPYETLKMRGPDLIENDSLRVMLGDYYDKWVGYQFELQNTTQREFELAKERQFELFKSMEFWDKMHPVDYESLVKSEYYNSWLTYTQGMRDWEWKRFQILDEKIEQLLILIDTEIAGD